MSTKKPINPAVVALQSRMFEHRLKVTKVFEEAQVHPSTWSRWADGGDPNMATFDKITAVVDRLIEQAEA